jgi:hypothetical protein
MFIKTDLEYLNYYVDNCYFKVPTYGYIYKIIDFGRSIYEVNGNICCSSHFKPGEDASTQYNFGPYYNNKNKTINPNYSFDLPRFACSIFDYFFKDGLVDDEICKTNPIANYINELCLDDHGVNILYKKDGSERYPDFKLYKMITRNMHIHIPQNQIHKQLFHEYKNNINKDNQKDISDLINIDEMQPLC